MMLLGPGVMVAVKANNKIARYRVKVSSRSKIPFRRQFLRLFRSVVLNINKLSGTNHGGLCCWIMTSQFPFENTIWASVSEAFQICCSENQQIIRQKKRRFLVFEQYWLVRFKPELYFVCLCIEFCGMCSMGRYMVPLSHFYERCCPIHCKL